MSNVTGGKVTRLQLALFPSIAGSRYLDVPAILCLLLGSSYNGRVGRETVEGVTWGIIKTVFFPRIHPSCRFESHDSHMPARWPDPSMLRWLMCAVVPQTRLHKSKGALTRARTLFLSLTSLSRSFYFAPLCKAAGCVIKSADDRRERIKYRTGRASIVVVDARCRMKRGAK